MTNRYKKFRHQTNALSAVLQNFDDAIEFQKAECFTENTGVIE